jgi:hypothetical protein
MEDLMSDAAEGPARTSFEAADDFEDAAFDELDEGTTTSSCPASSRRLRPRSRRTARCGRRL